MSNLVKLKIGGKNGEIKNLENYLLNSLLNLLSITWTEISNKSVIEKMKKKLKGKYVENFEEYKLPC